MTISRSLRLVLAFAVIYLIWGANYLAIHFGARGAPPLWFAALRCMLAAPLLLGFARWNGDAPPTGGRDWLVVVASAVLMLVLASGAVIWAQQWLPSGQAALIVASSAVWLAAFGAIGRHGERLGGKTLLGLVAGFCGVALLIGDGLRSADAPAIAYIAATISAAALAAGATLLRRRPPACGTAMLAGLQSMVAAMLLAVAALLTGETLQWQWSMPAVWALLYLAVCGSLLGYTAFNWLVREVTPAQLGTHAYVNPAVALMLGWLVLDEQLSAIQWSGALMVGIAVAVIMVSAPRRSATALHMRWAQRLKSS